MSSSSSSMLLLLLIIIIIINNNNISFSGSASTSTSTSTRESFIFGGCSKVKYTAGSGYEEGVSSILTTLQNSAIFSNYNNFTMEGPTIYALFQCRGDLPSDQCYRCVADAVTQLGSLCPASCGGAIQLDSCFVKYDNATFVGLQDKTPLANKCGPSIPLTSDALTNRDVVLDNLLDASGGYNTFRRTSSRNFQGVAQCTGDLTPSQCQDCLSDAIGRLKTQCGASTWADIFFAKCYARYSLAGTHSRSDDNNHNDDEIEKTLAILIGLIAGVALIIVFLSFLSKVCEKHKDGK